MGATHLSRLSGRAVGRFATSYLISTPNAHSNGRVGISARSH